MPSHLLTSFDIQKYYENESRFNGVHSRNNLCKIKDRTYQMNLDEYELIETDWIALYVNDINVPYFDSFGVKHIKKVKEI